MKYRVAWKKHAYGAVKDFSLGSTSHFTMSLLVSILCVYTHFIIFWFIWCLLAQSGKDHTSVRDHFPNTFSFWIIVLHRRSPYSQNCPLSMCRSRKQLEKSEGCAWVHVRPSKFPGTFYSSTSLSSSPVESQPLFLPRPLLIPPRNRTEKSINKLRWRLCHLYNAMEMLGSR